MLTLSYFKIGAALAVGAAIFFVGVDYGKDKGRAEIQPKLEKAVEQRDASYKAHLEDKAEWERAKAQAAVDVAEAKAKSVLEAQAVEAATQARIASINKQWASKLKGVEDAAKAALEYVRNPQPSADPVTDGMWVDVWACTNTGDPAGLYGVSASAGGTADAPLRCRLHQSTAARLIQRAAEANKVVENYNACTDALRVLSPSSFAREEPSKP